MASADTMPAAGPNQLLPEQRPHKPSTWHRRRFHRLYGELNQRLKSPAQADQAVNTRCGPVPAAIQRTGHLRGAETVEACRALDKPHLTGLVNGVLRAAEREGAPEPNDDSSRYSHPVWMVEKLRHNWPEDWQAILDVNNTQAPMTLRVNALRFRREEYLELLAEAGIEARPTRFAPHGIQLERPVPVERRPGSKTAVPASRTKPPSCTTLLDLQPGQRVLDACRARRQDLRHPGSLWRTG